MKQTNLTVDTAPVKRTNEDGHRTDGEAFSFVISVAGMAFKGSRFFGTKKAQENMRKRIIEQWPAVPRIENEVDL